jgi:hypothetical protein
MQAIAVAPKPQPWKIGRMVNGGREGEWRMASGEMAAGFSWLPASPWLPLAGAALLPGGWHWQEISAGIA